MGKECGKRCPSYSTYLLDSPHAFLPVAMRDSIAWQSRQRQRCSLEQAIAADKPCVFGVYARQPCGKACLHVEGRAMAHMAIKQAVAVAAAMASKFSSFRSRLL